MTFLKFPSPKKCDQFSLGHDQAKAARSLGLSNQNGNQKEVFAATGSEVTVKLDLWRCFLCCFDKNLTILIHTSYKAVEIVCESLTAAADS